MTFNEKKRIHIREFKPNEDVEKLVNLFYTTVHTINRKDYIKDQLNVWANEADRMSHIVKWEKEFNENDTFIAEIDEQVVGFIDCTKAGYLDRLFVDADFQGQGIATALVKKVEAIARQNHLEKIELHASITAKPFFEHLGYQVLTRNIVTLKGIELLNYHMCKSL